MPSESVFDKKLIPVEEAERVVRENDDVGAVGRHGPARQAGVPGLDPPLRAASCIRCVYIYIYIYIYVCVCVCYVTGCRAAVGCVIVMPIPDSYHEERSRQEVRLEGYSRQMAEGQALPTRSCVRNDWGFLCIELANCA